MGPPQGPVAVVVVVVVVAVAVAVAAEAVFLQADAPLPHAVSLLHDGFPERVAQGRCRPAPVHKLALV